MRKMNRRRTRQNRGSALLVSLMVIVGLSLLGLAFVAISETESTIAKNQSQALQTLSVAEAGAKMVVEWFQDPAWGIAQSGMPANAACSASPSPCSATPGQKMKTIRNSGSYSGVYKPKASTKLFDKPYRPSEDDRLYGTENNADIIINATTAGQATLDAINNILLGANASDKLGGQVTDIRIYAPPIVGGIVNSNGFWEGGQRYGVATIKVTAQQFARTGDPTSSVIASHSVRMVVGELPLPIPAGPIQGDANVSFGGSFMVHWGMETSRSTLTPSRTIAAMPWANAYDRPHFEHGYEPGTSLGKVLVTAGGSGYTSANPPVPVFTAPPAGGTPPVATVTVTSGAVTSVNFATAVARGSGYNPTAAPTVTFSCVAPCTGSGAAATAFVGSETYITTPGSIYDDRDYFHEMLGKTFDDPWYGARAVGDNMIDGATAYDSAQQCNTYRYNSDEASVTFPTWAFQWQDRNVYPTKKKVVFPSIVYDYWKRIAEQGRGYQGLYYFNYTGPAGGNNGGGLFQKFRTGASQPMSFWANSLQPPVTSGTSQRAGLGPGVYFFDTKTGANPQGLSAAARSTLLTDAEAWNSQDFNHAFLMQGFVYMNAVSFGTQGTGNAYTTLKANFPGEPFRDVGFPVWCTAVVAAAPTGTGATGAPEYGCTAANVWADCGGSPCRHGTGDGTFSCQDLNGNGKCDIVVMPVPAVPAPTSGTPGAVGWNSYDAGLASTASSWWPCNTSATGCTASGTMWIPKVWKSVQDATADYGAPCTLPASTYDGTNALPTDCSEPHEPYLNLIYPATALVSNNNPAPVVVGWENPSNQTRRSKILDTTQPAIPGTAIACPASPDSTICTSNDYDVDGPLVDLDVILYGIMYNEGQYQSPGNAAYFGSILIQDDVSGTGTADVWFDEKLIKGSWAPPKMPRVIVFSEQTDESSQ